MATLTGGSGVGEPEETAVKPLTRWGRTRRLAGAVALATVFVVGVAPTRVDAQGTPFGTLTLWEVQEYLRFKTGDDPASIVARLAHATLVGEATGQVCVYTAPCPVDAAAWSQVSLTTLVGSVGGGFNVLADTNPDSPLLSDLVFVTFTTISGRMDLRPAVLFLQSSGASGAPVALIDGTWGNRQLGLRGTLRGTFFIPVPAGCPTGFAYLDETATFVRCLEYADFSLGAPMTMLQVTLLKS